MTNLNSFCPKLE